MVFASLLVSIVLAPPAPLKVGLVGHSLVNHDIPQILRGIAESKGKSLVVYEQIINGSPLSHNWRESNKAETHPQNLYGDLKAEIARSKPPFDVVILTERVAIAECIKWEDSVGNVIRWRNHALKFNPKARVMLYSTWVGIKQDDWWKDVPDLPTWRRRIEADGKLFAQVGADATRDPRSTKGPSITLAPGHTAMGLLYDQLEAGKLPWLGKNIRAVMSDNIHLTSTGNYYIACVMYSSILGESPVGASGLTKGIWGGAPVTNLPKDQAAQLQRLAWQAVSASKS